MLRVFGVLGVLVMSCAPDPIAALDWSLPVEPTEAPRSPMPRLFVDGTTIVDERGSLVRLRGVNVCSLEFDREGKNWDGVIPILADPERWAANAVRMPVNQEWFLTDDAYVARVEALIDQANAARMYVILDVQWEVGRQLDPYHANILRVPTFGAGNTTEAFWHKATSRFASRTNVVYDLINEAHDVPDEDTAAAMQVLVDAIRTRTDTLIVVSGMDWAHTVDYYRTRPLRGANLAYSAHQYLPYDPEQTFDAKWRKAAAVIPVLLGEFLAEDAFAITVVDAAEAAGAVGWMPWALGCGFQKDDDLSKDPVRTLAERMRNLQRGASR